LAAIEVEDRHESSSCHLHRARAKIRRPVVPRDQLRIEVELKNWRSARA